MKTYSFEGRVTALSSITHNGGQSHGINQMLRREKFVQPDLTIEEVPVISGNGFRGLLRDIGMLHMCRSIGYGEPDGDGKPLGLTLPAFYFLFSGGTLSGDGGKALNLDRARQVKSLIPLVGIFGGALGNQIMPGKLKMGKMIPIVQETAHLLPPAIKGETLLPSIWDCCQREMYTRKDDEKNDKLRQVMSPQVLALIDQAKEAKRTKSEEGKPQEDTGHNQQMMYYVETLAAGTQFYLRMTLDDVTDVEFEAFITTLVEFSRKPFIGGKSGTGLGEVSLKFDCWLEIDSRLAPQGRELDRPLGNNYAAHLTNKGHEICEWLKQMAAQAA
jgi:CRISPR type IV-associated protein Csf2